MEERDLKNSYVFTLVKLFLFLVIFCFLIKIINNFIREINSVAGLSLGTITIALITTFAVYLFLVDLNGFYKNFQKFFFRSSFFACLFPSLLILLAGGYFFIPKIFNTAINKDIFVFAGAMSLFGHLIYISRSTRGKSFTTFINYLFIFSILFLLNIILFGFYLKIAFNLELGKVLLSGIQDGTSLMKDIFVQSFK